MSVAMGYNEQGFVFVWEFGNISFTIKTNVKMNNQVERQSVSQHDAKLHVGRCKFHPGQKVTFMCPFWHEKTKSVKEVEMPATIHSYNFKQARVNYLDPFDGQVVYKELEFSKLKAVNA